MQITPCRLESLWSTYRPARWGWGRGKKHLPKVINVKRLLSFTNQKHATVRRSKQILVWGPFYETNSILPVCSVCQSQLARSQPQMAWRKIRQGATTGRRKHLVKADNNALYVGTHCNYFFVPMWREPSTFPCALINADEFGCCGITRRQNVQETQRRRRIKLGTKPQIITRLNQRNNYKD